MAQPKPKPVKQVKVTQVSRRIGYSPATSRMAGAKPKPKGANAGGRKRAQ